MPTRRATTSFSLHVLTNSRYFWRLSKKRKLREGAPSAATGFVSSARHAGDPQQRHQLARRRRRLDALAGQEDADAFQGLRRDAGAIPAGARRTCHRSRRAGRRSTRPCPRAGRTRKCCPAVRRPPVPSPGTPWKGWIRFGAGKLRPRAVGRQPQRLVIMKWGESHSVQVDCKREAPLGRGAHKACVTISPV